MEYWVPEVEVAGVHELVGNALVMKGENERTTDLRGRAARRGRRRQGAMRDRGKIVLGLADLPRAGHRSRSGTTWPAARSRAARDPVISPTGRDRAACADTAYMRAEHMELLDDWRDEVVRDGRPDLHRGGRHGGTTRASPAPAWAATPTRREFCDRCHDYLGVKPYCWDCHVEPKGDQ